MKLEERLQLLSFDGMLRPIKVMILNDCTIPLPDGPLQAKKGDEVEVPRWIAEVLSKEGYAKPKEEVDVNYINNYHYKERRSASGSHLAQLPSDFYVAVGEFIRSLDEAIKRSPSHMLINDKDVSEKNVIELSQLRLSKIVRLAQTDMGDEEVPNMTPEEVLIYTQLKNAFNSWKNYIQSLMGVSGG
ncbi:GINS complex subunit Sld5 [Acidilobus sp.]|uniref:GINS complex subunit Sld5 n=1 Tax=Acidilobus sp. TaxID=1872109 RepID=UPI003D08D2A0